MIVKELKSRPRKPLSETISFKSKVVKNRLLSFFSSENLGSKTEMLQSLYTAKNTVDSVTDQPIVSSDDPVGDMREKLNKADTDATDSIESSSESAIKRLIVLISKLAKFKIVLMIVKTDLIKSYLISKERLIQI